MAYLEQKNLASLTTIKIMLKQYKINKIRASALFIFYLSFKTSA